ncbi:MAG: hypothetical protein ACE5HP_01280 [Gemmatimonadota bacterium]
MPDALIILLVALFALRLARRGSCCGWSWKRDRLEEGADRPRHYVETRRSAALPSRTSPQMPRRALSAPQETPLETLQRRFVDGRMTLEDYERELDRLYVSERSSAPSAEAPSRA